MLGKMYFATNIFVYMKYIYKLEDLHILNIDVGSIS